MISSQSNYNCSDSCPFSLEVNAPRTIYQFNFKRRVDRMQEGWALKIIQAYAPSGNTQVRVLKCIARN
jgi:hypothetical protein